MKLTICYILLIINQWIGEDMRIFSKIKSFFLKSTNNKIIELSSRLNDIEAEFARQHLFQFKIQHQIMDIEKKIKPSKIVAKPKTTATPKKKP